MHSKCNINEWCVCVMHHSIIACHQYVDYFSTFLPCLEAYTFALKLKSSGLTIFNYEKATSPTMVRTVKTKGKLQTIHKTKLIKMRMLRWSIAWFKVTVSVVD